MTSKKYEKKKTSNYTGNIHYLFHSHTLNIPTLRASWKNIDRVSNEDK